MVELPLLNLPPKPFKLKRTGEKTLIFDELRKKYLQLSPEEWVRQHVIRFLVDEKGYRKNLIKVEGGLKVNGLARRSDILAFNTKGEKVLLVECKSPKLHLTNRDFDQLTLYNIVHQASIVILTNGIQHYCAAYQQDQHTYTFLEDIPQYHFI